MLKLFVREIITNSRELVREVSRAVAASTAKEGINYDTIEINGKKYVNFNTIRGVEVILIPNPESVDEFFKIYQSLNLWVCNKEITEDGKTRYVEGRNKVYFCLKENKKSKFTQFAIKYYRTKCNSRIEFSIPLDKTGQHYDWKTLKQRLNCINHTVVTRSKIGGYKWVKEASSYDKDSFYSKCSKDDYGATLNEYEYTDVHVYDDIQININCSSVMHLFLTEKYLVNKKWNRIPNICVNGDKFRTVQYNKYRNEYEIRVNQIFKSIFGEYDDDAITKTVIAYKLGSLVINKNTYELDRFHYDRDTFKDSVNMLYNEIKTSGVNIDNEIDELVSIMEEKGYFIEEDEPLYEGSTSDADFSDDWVDPYDRYEIIDGVDTIDNTEDEEIEEESEDSFHLN